MEKEDKGIDSWSSSCSGSSYMDNSQITIRSSSSNLMDRINHKSITTTMKILLLGDSTVGKTSFFRALEGSAFDPTVISSIGIDRLFQQRKINENKILEVQIFDTAGQERYRSLAFNTLKGADGVLLMFDLTSRKSFDNIENWSANIHQLAKIDINKLLIGTKVDLEDLRVIYEDEIKEYILERDIQYFETSSKNYINIQESVDAIINTIYKKKTGRAIDERQTFLIPSKETKRKSAKHKNKCCEGK